MNFILTQDEESKWKNTPEIDDISDISLDIRNKVTDIIQTQTPANDEKYEEISDVEKKELWREINQIITNTIEKVS